MDQNHYFEGTFHPRSSSIKAIFRQRSSSIRGHLPSKVVFQQRWSSIKGRHHPRSSSKKVILLLSSSSLKGRLPSVVFFHQRSSSTKGRPPSKVVFHQSYVQYKPPCLPISKPNGEQPAAGTLAHEKSSLYDPKIGRWGLEMVHSWVIRGGEQLSLISFFDLSSPFLFNLTQLSPSLLNSPNFFFVPQNGRRGPEMVCPVII